LRSKGRLLVSTLAAAVTLTLPGIGAASASAAITAPAARLPITGLTQVLADGVHNHLFLSSRGSVAVTDVTGKRVITLEAGGQASYMVLSPNNRTLYVALRARDAVVAISTVTFRQTSVFRLTPAAVPNGLALQSGKLWVSYTAKGKRPGIGYFRLGPAVPRFVPAALPGPAWTTAPRLAADPFGEGTLVAIDNTAFPHAIASYGVSGAKPVLLAEHAKFTGCRSFADIAVSVGGAQVILACGGHVDHVRLTTKNLAAAGSYRSGRAPDAVAVALDGSVATGTAAPGARQLSVHRANYTAAMNTFRLGTSGDAVAPDGLAWASDATRLFVVLKRPATATSGAGFFLQTLTYPQFKPTLINLDPNAASITLGQAVSLSGSLELGGAAAPAGVKVQIVRQLAGSSGSMVYNVRTAAGGGFSLSNVPPRDGTWNYTAFYPTNGIFEPAWHTTSVTVTG
jgi:hypothetical protein